jgi:hypothetical protein
LSTASVSGSIVIVVDIVAALVAVVAMLAGTRPNAS